MSYHRPLILLELDDFNFPMFAFCNHVEKLSIIIPLDNFENLSMQGPFHFFFSSKKNKKFLFGLKFSGLLGHIEQVRFRFEI